ncbi:hypothetical protein [Moraxella marmotae]|uniref:hypothetical protein n=1 Tax=Moraxella marmotae TaxID=3344520 RepID=UPI0035F29866
MSMISVLALAMCEKLINTAIKTDDLTQESLAVLSGKTLRVAMHSPKLCVDVLFLDNHVRFEPVASMIFEPQGGTSPTPDCTLSVDNPKHLLSLIQNPTGNLPIRGDYQVLMHAKAIFEQFEPDVWGSCEQILGQQATSHLYAIGKEISPLITPVTGLIGSCVNQALQTAANFGNDGQLDQSILDKKQELLRLQSEIERQQAKLAEVQNQLQNHLTKNSPSTNRPTSGDDSVDTQSI